MKLSDTQLFILKTLRDGGKLITDDIANELFFSDVDGNDYRIIYPTYRKLYNNGLIDTGCAPSLNFTSYCLTNSGLEAIQEAEIKDHKRVNRSF